MDVVGVEYLDADELQAIEMAMAQAEAGQSHPKTASSSSSRSAAPPVAPSARRFSPPSATTKSSSTLSSSSSSSSSSSPTGLPIGLPDYLDYDLDIVFVGDNPGLTSSRNQKWYAHATNHFWRLLHDAGFLPTPLTHLDDHKVLQHKVGLTCLCSRPTRGTDELAREELTDGLVLLQAKLEQYRPRAICFNGVGIYESAVTGGAKARVGYQGDNKIVPGVSVFVMPSSRHVARVKFYSYEQKVEILRQVKKHIDEKREKDTK